MRKVRVQKRVWKDLGASSEIVDDGFGIFHKWATNYREFENGPGLYPIAIIERDDGSIKLVSAELIEFVEPLSDSAGVVVCRTGK